jgi:hypothetical protein
MPGNNNQVITKPQQKFVIPQMRVAPTEETVTWSTTLGDFQIWFPPKMDPLEHGSDVSTNGSLTRTIKKRIRRESKDKYPYTIYMLNDNEMVESTSPPEMVIE